MDKHNLEGKLKTMGLIFTIEAESPDYKANWVSISKEVKADHNWQKDWINIIPG